ncbi:MAG TPA: hypothetical protein VJ787_04020 [Thermoleophilia bacterium]|nr:hypothetical protein [Thermoleophilia bacterium]
MIEKHLRSIQILILAVGLSIGGYFAACAHTTPGQFKDAIVTCTLENSQNPQASAAVTNCLIGAVSGNYAACLSGLVTAGYWTVEEIACVVRRLATESAQRINAGQATDADRTVLDNANQWLKDNQIRFR